MPTHFFRFKQFTIEQHSEGMRVNTDGVLLGAWVDVNNAKRIVDIGTGTGIIALMLAQRNSIAKTEAVEINLEAAQQAQENINNSPWPSRIAVFNELFQQFAARNNTLYDLVVSNPPYFVDALLSPSAARTQARHTEELTHEELISYTKKILTPNGALCVVLPFSEGTKFIALALSHHFFCIRKTIVYTTKNKPPKRLLLHFSLREKPLTEEELFIHETGSAGYTTAYKNLTGDFYL